MWSTIEHMRCDYQALLDEACESIREADMEDILKVDDGLWETLTTIEARMEELLILKESPEKVAKEDMNTAFSNDTRSSLCCRHKRTRIQNCR